jgi:hypothetical protein
MNRLAGTVVAAATALLLGCSGEGEPVSAPTPEATPTVTEPAAPPEATSPSPTPPASTDPPLPADCSDLLLSTAIQEAIGVTFEGRTTFLRTAPDEASGRLGRVTCGYGVVGEDGGEGGEEGPPVVEASVIAYPDAQEALSRLDATVVRAQADGSTAESVEFADFPGTTAFLLSDQESASIVAARGQYTYVIAANVLPVAVGSSGAAEVDLSGLQELLASVLEATGQPAEESTEG